MKWHPSLGAWAADGGTRFRVWAPQAERVEVVMPVADFAGDRNWGHDGTYNAGNSSRGSHG